jgi:hypothetical protein
MLAQEGQGAGFLDTGRAGRPLPGHGGNNRRELLVSSGANTLCRCRNEETKPADLMQMRIIYKKIVRRPTLG